MLGDMYFININRIRFAAFLFVMFELCSIVKLFTCGRNYKAN